MYCVQYNLYTLNRYSAENPFSEFFFFFLSSLHYILFVTSPTTTYAKVVREIVRERGYPRGLYTCALCCNREELAAAAIYMYIRICLYVDQT